MTGFTRREAVRLGAAGLAAIALPACGGSGRLRAAASAPAEWRQFQGTTLNFISENTAPTSAIAANLKPFEELTGIRIRITQLELAALVQKVALDFASGLGSYQIVYADPYQVLAPYREALVDLTTMMRDPSLPKVEDVGDFIPTQLDAAGRFVDKGKLYTLPYDAPTMIWQYRKDLFQKYGARMKQDLGFDPTPSDSSTWDEFYKTSKWFRDNARHDVPYGHGHQAKQHDSLMNDFSNLLWAYGGDYFKDGVTVGRLGSLDPGEPVLDSPEAVQAADMYRRLVSIAHPGSLGWDWDGLGAAFAAGEMAMAVNWHEFAASNEASKIKGKVGYARLPRGPKRSANMYGGTGLGINATASPREQKAAWLYVNWATSKKVQLANLKSKVGGGTPTRDSVYRLPEVQKAKHPPSSMPNILTADAVFEAWRPENIGLRPKIAAWNECDTAIFTQLSKMLAGQQSPESCMSNTKQGFVAAIDNATSLRNA